MILYQLKCPHDHEFEAWFKDAATYDAQSGAGEISCPYCGSKKVSKAPMAPRLAKGTGKSDSVEERAKEVADQIFQTAEKLRQHVEENCDYVGEQFADEARKIHYGESEERGIYGTASDDEASKLREEGVDFHQLRWFQRRND